MKRKTFIVIFSIVSLVGGISLTGCASNSLWTRGEYFIQDDFNQDVAYCNQYAASEAYRTQQAQTTNIGYAATFPILQAVVKNKIFKNCMYSRGWHEVNQ